MDDRKVKTPAGSVLVVPSHPLAMAVAVEWNSQIETIKPETMHLVIIHTVFNPKSAAIVFYSFPLRLIGDA